MITTKNYYSEIESVDLSKLPAKLKAGHEFINELTQNGKTWKGYDTIEDVRPIVDEYLRQLNAHISKISSAGKPSSAAKVHKSPIRQTAPQPPDGDVQLVERIPEELRFIRRFVNFNGKVKSKEQILTLVNSLQKAMVEKRLRKTSPYAQHILYIQDKLVSAFNKMKKPIQFSIDEEMLVNLKGLLGEEKLIASVPFLKRYIALNEKIGVKEKALLLYKHIESAQDKGKLTPDDPYHRFITKIKKNLKAFVNGDIKTIRIEKNELNGLEDVLGIGALAGVDGSDSDEPRLMNSMDFAKVRFITIGFTGKWLDLIGDPSRGFTAMVFGKPKTGKSYLCLEFAGYLARNHGNVLYVAKEEGLDATLQIKTRDKNVAHENLTISDGIPSDLTPYDFIFLDSVTSMNLKPTDLKQLEEENPEKSFIYIFQSTKLGNFKGANSFQHDVDVVIEVPEKGIAIQNGRFNQGGQINIFDDQMQNAA